MLIYSYHLPFSPPAPPASADPSNIFDAGKSVSMAIYSPLFVPFPGMRNAHLVHKPSWAANRLSTIFPAETSSRLATVLNLYSYSIAVPVHMDKRPLPSVNSGISIAQSRPEATVFVIPTCGACLVGQRCRSIVIRSFTPEPSVGSSCYHRRWDAFRKQMNSSGIFLSCKVRDTDVYGRANSVGNRSSGRWTNWILLFFIQIRPNVPIIAFPVSRYLHW